jgi:hypothetical protein
VGIAILLMLINTYLAHKTLPILSKYSTDEENKQGMLGAYASIFIAIPIASFLLSLVITFIPYKNLKYSKKYFQFSLIILVILEAFLSIMLGLILISK